MADPGRGQIKGRERRKREGKGEGKEERERERERKGREAITWRLPRGDSPTHEPLGLSGVVGGVEGGESEGMGGRGAQS